MKKILLCISALFLSLMTMAQSTYYVSPTGNVGIGTTTPGEALDVTGNIQASGVVKARNVISIFVTPTGDVDITAVAGTSYILPYADLTADRTITLTSTVGDVLSFTFTGTTTFHYFFSDDVYLADESTLSSIPNNTIIVIRRQANEQWYVESISQM